MLDDNFFRSLFLRHKLPATFLFSNGACRVDPNDSVDDGPSSSSRACTVTSGPGGVVRNVPIRVLSGGPASPPAAGLSLSDPRNGSQVIPGSAGPTGSADPERLVLILNGPSVSSSDGSMLRKFSASPRVTFNSDLNGDGVGRTSNEYNSRSPTTTVSNASAGKGRDSPLTTRTLPTIHSIPMASYRSVPIVKKYSAPILSLQQQRHQQENSNEKNAGCSNRTPTSSVTRTIDGLTALYGSARDGVAAARLIRSVNNTPTPIQSTAGGQTATSTAARTSRTAGGLRAGVSTPSLFAEATSSTRRSESPAPKPAIFPSFLRRTQTAHSISPFDLPTPPLPAGQFSLPSAAALSAALRHSLHETTVVGLLPTTVASGSLTSLLVSQQQQQNEEQQKEQQKEQQLRFGGKSVSFNGWPVAGGGGGAPASGGMASAKVRQKKASFLPPCIRAQRDASDAEAENEPLLAPLPAARRDDPVEEAIRSLESFDPSDYISADKNHLKSPTLCAAFSPPTRRPATVTGGDQVSSLNRLCSTVKERASTVSSSSVSSTSADAPASSASSSAAGGALSDVTLSSSSEAASPPQASHWPSRERSSLPGLRSAVSASSSASATPTFARSIDSASLPTARGDSGLRLSLAAMGNTVQPSGAVVSQAYGYSNRGAPTPSTDYGRAMPPADYDTGRQTNEEEEEDRLRRYDNVTPQFYRRNSPFHFSRGYGNDVGEQASISTAADAEAHLRKRFLCTQLTDCAKVIEINAHKMQQFEVLASGDDDNGMVASWRQPHVLCHNLPAIRDTAYTIEFALEELVDALGRILIEPADLKHDEFRRLTTPLATSLSMLRQLRANLDAVGWSLTALARPADGTPHGHDALDQFVTILRQLPKDCYKFVQWVYQLDVWNPQSGAFVFLAASNSTASGAPPPPAPLPAAPLETDFVGGVATPRAPQGQGPPWEQSPALFASQKQQSYRPQQQQQQYRNDASRWSPESPSSTSYGSRSNGNSRSTTPSRHLYEKNNNSHDRWMTTTPIAPFEQQQQRVNRNNFGNNKLRTKSPNTVRFIFDNNNHSGDNSQQQEGQKEQIEQQHTRQQQQQLDARLRNKDNNGQNNNNNNNVNNNGVDTMDGGESTSSSSEAAEAEEPPVGHRKTPVPAPTVPSYAIFESQLDPMNPVGPIEPIGEPAHGSISVSTVYEEDDLMSVTSDAVESLYGDYATADSLARPQSARASAKGPGYGSAAASGYDGRTALRAATADERELLCFHAPQVVNQTAELCRLIEQFFNVVEERRHPKTFIQIIQMICIKAQTLGCIARVVARDDACLAAPGRRLHVFLSATADRLDALLNDCAANARVAREKTESVPAVQAMVSSVVGVSQAALGLRQFWTGCV